ncbi:TPA: hypothetical protein R1940_001836 [Staphylococcus delphini]|nr:hypothetical protein [Staphylococcus delphini]HEC2168207.1 hypothetical protein [Staphylococcus delphini]HEC2171317.1 hypothetical protein [Staphylococcus delphini]HEC2188670.1 hypothetical protein [Staphylococcus delphini]HEC2190742.1 hypothetical protein [Staphylococcus delphini]
MSNSFSNIFLTLYLWFKTQMEEIVESFHIKFEKNVENRWFWLIVAFVVIVAIAGYAYYCTSKGYSFNGNFKIHWPKVWQMGIGCKK